MRIVILCLVLCLAVGCFSQSCTIVDNTDFDNGYLTMLYNVSSAEACCEACAGFEECTHFSWIKNPAAGEWYKRCFPKTSGEGKKTDSGQTAGYNNRPDPAPKFCSDTVEEGVDYNNGWSSLVLNVPSADACCKACSNYPGCNYWTWNHDPNAGDWKNRCYFKPTNSPRVSNVNVTSGKSNPVPSPKKRDGKRGLAWFNSQSCSDMKLMTKASWMYTWATAPDLALVPCMHQLGIEFVPMQWGGGGLDQLNFTIWGGGGALLAFNEPNFHSQSNVAPADAVKMWPTIEAIAKQRNLRISSPAAAACGPLTDCYASSWSPVPWFDDFFNQCKGCKIDFLATHIYTCNMTELTAFIDSLKKYGKQIWLTEFACPAAGKPDAFEIDFMKQALAYLDSNPIIERYAWFGTRLDPNDGWLGPQVDLLDDSKCALTELGKLYNS